ncbi:leucine-rich repeat protein [Luteolibacter yonseiensis]|uniref:Leucine-rich repeat protein n=1 Tax=Luteolibacter yonseiensis TaxID=1144680 RepID=A0A934R4G7_9BACT|nr:leucine-rich repeat protein [Luteolibacter yonseiensis]MBK1816971.1 leucine-rich repeat protein [Luteolibacter yonseiensis]
MKKRSFLSAICSVAFLCQSPLFADTYGPYTYTEHADSITIDRYESEVWQAVVAEVPETIAGKPVTVIGAHAFARYWMMKHIVLPKGIVRIEDGAFEGCSEVVDINIPSGVVSIGESAFASLFELQAVDLPSGLTHLGDRAFEDCWEIRSVKIPPGITRIGPSTFYGCNSLSEVTFPATLTHIGDYAFGSCWRLEYARFAGNAPALGVDAFDGVSNFFAVYSYYWSKGFTYPTWQGFDSELIRIPRLEILGPKGFPLKNGGTVQAFGDAKVGKRGKSKSYVIDNGGARELANISLTKSGANKGDFTVTPLPKKSLKGYKSMEFIVTFNPKGKGTRNATLLIRSNDPRNPAFEVKLTGKGLAR